MEAQSLGVQTESRGVKVVDRNDCYESRILRNRIASCMMFYETMNHEDSTGACHDTGRRACQIRARNVTSDM